MQRLTTRLVKEGETKNCVKYSELDGLVRGTIYLEKSVFNGDKYPVHMSMVLQETKDPNEPNRTP